MLILSSPVEAERLIQENTIALLYFGRKAAALPGGQPKLEALLAEYPGIAAAKVDTAHSIDLAAAQHLYHPWDSGFRRARKSFGKQGISASVNWRKIRRLYSFLVEAPPEG